MNNTNAAPSSSPPGSSTQGRIQAAVVLGIGLLAAVSCVTATPLGITGGSALTSAATANYTTTPGGLTNTTTAAPTSVPPQPSFSTVKFIVVLFLTLCFMGIACCRILYVCLGGEEIEGSRDRRLPRSARNADIELRDGVEGEWVDGVGDSESTGEAGVVEETPIDGDGGPREETPLLFKHTGRKKKSYS